MGWWLGGGGLGVNRSTPLAASSSTSGTVLTDITSPSFQHYQQVALLPQVIRPRAPSTTVHF